MMSSIYQTNEAKNKNKFNEKLLKMKLFKPYPNQKNVGTSNTIQIRRCAWQVLNEHN